jgi:hypothetical protein
MKLDQTAWYCNTTQQADYLKEVLGLSNEPWVKDTVTAISSVFGRPPTKNVAQLQFCYTHGGHEIEILRYISGPHFHERTAYKEPFISHIGFHLADDEDFPDIAGLGKDTCKLVQETFTESHTSEYLTTGAGAGRLYHYKIFQIQTGNYLKYIKRIRDNEKAYQKALAEAG